MKLDEREVDFIDISADRCRKRRQHGVPLSEAQCQTTTKICSLLVQLEALWPQRFLDTTHGMSSAAWQQMGGKVS
jgi:hypothetical protein